MPYFTHLRKKSYFAVVETNGKLYIDGQGYDPDTLKPTLNAEFDVFSPTSNSSSFFDFGSPVICLPRSSYICKTNQLTGVNSGRVKVFDSSLFLTGQSIGNFGVSSNSAGTKLFFTGKKDPSGTDQKNDKIVSMDSTFGLLQSNTSIGIQTGSENKPYRLNTVFWNQTTGSTRLFAANSETLLQGNVTSNNVAAFTEADITTYQALQSDKTEVNQLVYLDANKANSTSNYAVTNRAQITSSSTKTPQTVMYDTVAGTRYIPTLELVDSGASSYWISVFGDLTGNTQATAHSSSALAISPNNEIYAASVKSLYKLSASGSVVWQKAITNDSGLGAMTVDSSGQPLYVHQATMPNNSKGCSTTAFSSSGAVLWAYSWLSNGDSPGGYDIALDSQGNICSIQVNLFNTSGVYYLVKRSASGAMLWKSYIGGGNGVAVDSGANVWCVGKDIVNTSTGESRAFIQKNDSSGTNLFYKRLYLNQDGGNGWDTIAIDSADNVYVAGVSSNSLRVAKYNSSGTVQWFYVAASNAYKCRITIDKNNNLYLAYGSNSANRCTVLKFTSSGSVAWSNTIALSYSTNFNTIKCDSFGNLYLLFSGNFVQNDPVINCVMKVPPDGSGTGTYNFARGTLTYQSASVSWAQYTPTAQTLSVTNSLNATDYTVSLSSSDSSYTTSKQSVGATYDPAPNSYVGCFASNAVWANFYEGSGPIYFTGSCPYPSTLGLDFVRVRFITQASPTCKRVWSTISNPSSLSLAISSDINYRNVRPFLFKNDNGALMLGVFAYYNGTSTADNVAALMLFSVGSTTETDSITLTYQQRIDLSDGGTGFVTSVTPIDDTQKTWLVNYGDKAKIYTWSQASNFTLTNTYSWGRSGQVDSYGIDSRGRLWYTTGDVLSYIPLKTDPATVDVSLKAYFDDSVYSYTDTTINSNLYVSAYALDGGRTQRTVTVKLEGGVVTFADGSTTKTVTTSASNDLAIPIKVLGSGIFQAKLS